jgi:hypothetical protein
MKNKILFLVFGALFVCSSFISVRPKVLVNGFPGGYLLATSIKSGDAVTLTDTVQIDFNLVGALGTTNNVVVVGLYTDPDNTAGIMFGNRQINASNYLHPADVKYWLSARVKADPITGYGNLRAKASVSTPDQIFLVTF